MIELYFVKTTKSTYSPNSKMVEQEDQQNAAPVVEEQKIDNLSDAIKSVI